MSRDTMRAVPTPQPHLIAHRGLPQRHLENSLASLRAAIPHADAVEFDVRRAACGTLVCAHDASLARVAGAPVEVADRTFAWIRAVEPQIASFDEAVTALAPRTGMCVDLKSTGDGVEAQLIAALRRLGVGLDTAETIRRGDIPGVGEALVEGPTLRALVRVARQARTVARLYVVPGRTRPWRLALRALCIRAVAHGVALPKRLASRRQIRWLHLLGLRVFVYTVNDADRYVQLASNGADAIFTDIADTIRRG